VVALFLDELGYRRWPAVAPTWGLAAAVAPRAGTKQQWRTIGARNALTGPVRELDGYLVGRRQVLECYAQLDHAYPAAELRYVIQANWHIHTHPAVLAAWAHYPRLQPVWWPTYAPWLNPIEQRWRWVRPDLLKMHRGVADGPQVKPRVRDFLVQFAPGSQELLHYVGLSGEGKLATVINTS
jgi:hypothetical protein